MANLRWRRAQARCPYYYTSRDEAITCSCGAGGIKGHKILFVAALYCSDWFRRFCCSGYRRCPTYERITREIEEGGGA